MSLRWKDYIPIRYRDDFMSYLNESIAKAIKYYNPHYKYIGSRLNKSTMAGYVYSRVNLDCRAFHRDVYYTRSNAKREAMSNMIDIYDVHEFELGAQNETIAEYKNTVLKMMVNMLEEEIRDNIVKYYYWGYTLSEIAKEKKTSIFPIFKALQAGIKQLKKIVHTYNYSLPVYLKEYRLTS